MIKITLVLISSLGVVAIIPSLAEKGRCGDYAELMGASEYEVKWMGGHAYCYLDGKYITYYDVHKFMKNNNLPHNKQ